MNRSSTEDSSLSTNLVESFEELEMGPTAFLDILWQDSLGNSALMLAAAENRSLTLKGILHVAVRTGKLNQVLELRNQEGLTALELAVREGNETCAMLITQVAKQFLRPKSRSRARLVDEDDINCEFEKAAVIQTATDASENESGSIAEAAAAVTEKSRRLSREKMSNNLRRVEYFQLIKRSRSAHSRFHQQQRTFSSESTASHHTPTATPTPPPLVERNNLTAMPSIGTAAQTASQSTDIGPAQRQTMGERLRSMFSRKGSDPSSSSSDSGPPALTEMMRRLVEPGRAETSQPDVMHLPQNSTEMDNTEDDSFRSSLFTSSQGFRLPPLDRRRHHSESRKKRFIVE